MDDGIVKVDWNIFGTIHSGNPEDAFQKLTEQLFCFEFSQPYGIYRFYNQRYIETEPIKYGKEIVGFQSKYYNPSTKLSTKKSDFIEVIEKVHTKHPDLTKIIFYINKEPAESSIPGQNKPIYIEDIESYGIKHGIKIEWKGPNQIETMLIRPELYYLRDYFFATGNGIRKRISQIQQHSKDILNNIYTVIGYHGESIHLSYDSCDIGKFIDSEKHVLIIYGKGGCGKSALVKSYLEQEKNCPLFVFRASDFVFSDFKELIYPDRDCTWEEILSGFDNTDKKICLIDAAEKIIENNNNEIFRSILNSLKKHGWHIIFTIREEYRITFINNFLEKSDLYEEIHVKELSQNALCNLQTKYGFLLPENDKLLEFLKTPFYLNLYLSDDRFSSSSNPSDFFTFIWNHIICNNSQQKELLHIRRGETIIKIVKTNIKNGISYYIPENDDWQYIELLKNDGIINEDITFDGFYLSHDVFEEIVLIHYINREYQRKKSIEDFFERIGDSIVVRKAFRLWLHIQFENHYSDINHFLSEILRNEHDYLVWKDDILIALFSEENMTYAPFLENILQENDYALLLRSLHLLNTACKVVDDEFLGKFVIQEEMQTFNIYDYNIPSGQGWCYLISYAYKHREKILWTNNNIDKILHVIHSWCMRFTNGETTRNAGLLALYLYEISDQESYHLFLETKESDILRKTILYCAKEIYSELYLIIKNVINDYEFDCSDNNTLLCDFSLKNIFNVGSLCEADPNLVIQLAKRFWIQKERDYLVWNSFPNFEDAFGLNTHLGLVYYPSSAFQTPTLKLLHVNPQKTIEFIIEIINYSTKEYYKSDFKDECREIDLVFPSGKIVKQIASSRLWGIHRGTSYAPGLLECILMALERWLYQLFQICSKEMASDICKNLLMKSNSVAITAVVANMVIAYPNKLFDIACIFLHTPILFIYDLQRFAYDSIEKHFRSIIPNDKIFDDERSNSDNLPFRKKHLELIILDYQLNQFDLSQNEFHIRKELLYKALEEGFTPENMLSDEEKLAFYRMDARKMDFNLVHKGRNSIVFSLNPVLPDMLEQKQQKSQGKIEKNNRYIELSLWADARYTNDKGNYSKYIQYESNPSLAFNDAQFISSDDSIPAYLKKSVPIKVKSVLVNDFKNYLTEEQISECRDTIISLIITFLDKNNEYEDIYYLDAAVSALPALFSEQINPNIVEEPKALLFILTCYPNKLREWSINTIREKVWPENETLARAMSKLFTLLKPGYDEEVLVRKHFTTIEYFEKNKTIILSILQQPSDCLSDITRLNYEQLLTLNLFYPKDSNHFLPEKLLKIGKMIWNRLFCNDRNQCKQNYHQDYDLEQSYISWLAGYLLNSPTEVQDQIVKNFSVYLDISDNTNLFLESIMKEQDQIRKNTSFWYLWNSLFDTMEKISESQRSNITDSRQKHQYYSIHTFDKMLSTYLFAVLICQEGIHAWHTLDENCYYFFSKAVDVFGFHQMTLFSIAQVLNNIGFIFFNEGINWLSKIIIDNKHLKNSALPINTEYYIEEYIQRYISANRVEIKNNRMTKNKVMTILNFLVDKGSTCGFLLREKIS